MIEELRMEHQSRIISVRALLLRFADKLSWPTPSHREAER